MKVKDAKSVVCFTDGSCLGNPGPGGWGVILQYNGNEKCLSGHEEETTNNRMELRAAIEALNALKYPCQVDLYTDSEYVRKGITEWMKKWKSNGWKNAKRQPIKNQDLWQMLDEAQSPHSVQWHWVKGHSGHPENDRVDELARNAINNK